MKIESIITKNGKTLNLENVTVLVGPNNTGKSTILADIKEIFLKGYNGKRIFIEKLIFKNNTEKEFKIGLRFGSNPNNVNDEIVAGLGPNLQNTVSHSVNQTNIQQWVQDLTNNWQSIANHQIGNLKVTVLNSETRLSLANEKDAKHDEQSPNQAIQEIYYKTDSEDLLQKAFNKAFDQEIRFDPNSNPGVMRFRIAKDFGELPILGREAGKILKDHKKLDDQGDGFKSFVGIALGTVISQGRIILIDEPEAFLHPTQARVLGEWIAKHSETPDIQIIIATHSADILEGILLGKKDTTVFRLNRTDDNTSFNQIPSEITTQLGSMPILSSQQILESIFYRGVIICEGDSDRAIYKAVYTQKSDKREHLFVNAIGKGSIKKFIPPIKAANIPVCTIVDIDILNSESIFKDLIESLDYDGDISEFLQTRAIIAKSVEGIDEKQVFEKIKQEVKDLSEDLQTTQIDLTKTRRALDKIHKNSGKWKIVKENGLDGIPEDVREKARDLLDDLKKIGLFVVPVGELERWIPLDNAVWIEKALELIQSDKMPESLQTFVQEIASFLEK